MPDEDHAATVSPTRLAIFVAGYFLSVRLGEYTYGSLAFPSPFWLPDSIFLCALLLAPRSQWWVFAAAIWPVRLIAGATPGTPPWFQLLSIANDTAKGLASAWLLHRLTRRPIRLTTMHEFLLFLSIAGLTMPALSALIAAPARYALGDPFWRAAHQWFLGDALTQVIVTPTLLYWFTRSFDRLRRPAELFIVSACLAATLFVGWVLNHSSNSLPFVYLPVPFLIWAAVRLGPFGTANSLTLVAIVSMVAAVGGTGVFAGETPDQAVLSLQLFLLVLATSLLTFAIVVVEREELLIREAALSQRLIDAQDRERGRIASELHDDIGQQMTLLLIEIEQLRRSADSEDGRRQATALADTVTQLASAIQGLSHELHPLTIDMMGFDTAVRALCRQLSERQGFQVQIQCPTLPADLRPELSLCAYRIIQEGLHNVIKHSGVNGATIDLDVADDRMIVSVSDTGRGFDPSRTDHRSGLGLLSMRERVRSLGGELVIETKPESGTRLRAVLPLQRQAHDTTLPRPVQQRAGLSALKPDLGSPD